MNQHAKLAIEALRKLQREDAQLALFVLRFGRPGDSAIEKVDANWWDRAAWWNPCVTPRDELIRLEALSKKVDWAVAWVQSVGGSDWVGEPLVDVPDEYIQFLWSSGVTSGLLMRDAVKTRLVGSILAGNLPRDHVERLHEQLAAVLKATEAVS